MCTGTAPIASAGKRRPSHVGAWIYRDEGFEVQRVLRGDVPASLTIRGVGGTVADVQMVYHGQPVLRVGRPYLVFLAYEQTPTREGLEGAWTILNMELGVFEPADTGRWRNVTSDEVIAEADLS